ncbi:hypothetical protein HQQ81_16575 [Microbacteriaceae bacterium VKM Ac-2854]|nr:hypothetical protein [Microbacteriaceae bacterium VKM Ac-2854]
MSAEEITEWQAGSPDLAAGLIATTEASWLVTSARGDVVLGQIAANLDGSFSAHDADDSLVGSFPSRDAAQSSILARAD